MIPDPVSVMTGCNMWRSVTMLPFISNLGMFQPELEFLTGFHKFLKQKLICQNQRNGPKTIEILKRLFFIHFFF